MPVMQILACKKKKVDQIRMQILGGVKSIVHLGIGAGHPLLCFLEMIFDNERILSKQSETPLTITTT